jgi:tetratricopeptide (TPR) repeat protein
MSNGQDEFVTIRPRRVALSHQGGTQRARSRISLGMVLVAAGVVLLLAVAVWVFMYLPGRVEVAEPPIRSAAAPAAPPEAAAPAPVVVGKAPYEALQIDRERKRAQETLASFVRLQIKLDEEMHVRDWGAEPFDVAQQLANDGDALFTQQKFDDAMANYEKGIAALEALQTQGESRFNDALKDALDAIDRRDAAAAEAAYAIAASVYPDDARIAEGRSRIQRLPQIIELLADADRAKERGDMRTTLAKYRAIQALDPKTQGLQTPLGEAQSRVANLDYQGTLSAGYAALDAGDYDAARRAFEAALRQRPNDGAAQDGMSQVEQRSTLSNIEQYHQKAIRDEADERWTDAVASLSEGSRRRRLDQVRDGRQSESRCTRRSRPQAERRARRPRRVVFRRHVRGGHWAVSKRREDHRRGTAANGSAEAPRSGAGASANAGAGDADVGRRYRSDHFATWRVGQVRPQGSAVTPRPLRADRQPRRPPRRAPRTDRRAADASGGNRLPGIDLTVSAEEPLIRPATFTPTRDDLHGRSWFGEHRVQLISTAVLLAVAWFVWFIFTAKSVQLTFDPPDANASISGGFDITLGGIFVLREGTYELHANAEGYEKLVMPLNIGEARNQAYAFALTPLPGRIDFDTQPAPAEVWVDGVSIGTTPLAAVDVAAGEHKVSFRNARYLPQEMTVTIDGKRASRRLLQRWCRTGQRSRWRRNRPVQRCSSTIRRSATRRAHSRSSPGFTNCA